MVPRGGVCATWVCAWRQRQRPGDPARQRTTQCVCRGCVCVCVDGRVCVRGGGGMLVVHGGVSAPSCCAFIHRVAFKEVSGHRVLFKSVPENWGLSASGTTHKATYRISPWKRAEESMSEQGLLQAEATDWRPKGWILLWACFIWPAQ